MSITVNIHKAKTNLSDLIRRVEGGDEIIIARDGAPVAKIVALEPENKLRSAPGLDAGKVTIMPDFDEPLEEFDFL